MSYDDLDDWEIENENETPVLNVTNKKHLKQMEERKLVEESDNVLTKELFEDKSEEQIRAYLTNLCDSHILYSIVVYDIANKTKTQFIEPFEIKTEMPEKYTKNKHDESSSQENRDTSVSINTEEPRE